MSTKGNNCNVNCILIPKGLSIKRCSLPLRQREVALSDARAEFVGNNGIRVHDIAAADIGPQF